ncbi:MAG: preprotein translocase subunit YajC [Catalinimonas sp.]
MFSYIYLQAGAGSSLPTFLMMGAIFVVFYFFMIRPQQKKQKDQKSFLESIKEGDEVVTIGGMHGRVVEADAATVTLQVDRGMKLRFERSAVSLEYSKKTPDPKLKSR